MYSVSGRIRRVPFSRHLGTHCTQHFDHRLPFDTPYHHNFCWSCVGSVPVERTAVQICCVSFSSCFVDVCADSGNERELSHRPVDRITYSVMSPA